MTKNTREAPCNIMCTNVYFEQTKTLKQTKMNTVGS